MVVRCALCRQGVPVPLQLRRAGVHQLHRGPRHRALVRHQGRHRRGHDCRSAEVIGHSIVPTSLVIRCWRVGLLLCCLPLRLRLPRLRCWARLPGYIRMIISDQSEHNTPSSSGLHAARSGPPGTATPPTAPRSTPRITRTSSSSATATPTATTCPAW